MILATAVLGTDTDSGSDTPEAITVDKQDLRVEALAKG